MNEQIVRLWANVDFNSEASTRAWVESMLRLARHARSMGMKSKSRDILWLFDVAGYLVDFKGAE